MGRNVSEYVAESADARGSATALVVGATRWTWSDVEEAVTAAASGFRTFLRPGDRVGLVLGNRPEFVVAYFGALRAGLVAVPLNPGFTAVEVASCLGDAGVTAVVVDRDSVAAVRAAELTGVRLLLVGPGDGSTHRFDDLLVLGRSSPTPPADESAGSVVPGLAVIMYTSGTTGQPRGAMLTHAALRASVEQVAGVSVDGQPLMRPDDVVLVVLPLAHVYSLNGTLGAWARSGATAVLAERFDAEATLRLVGQHQVTNIPGAPPLWAAWARRADLADALSGVRVMFSGAAALPAEVVERVMAVTGRPIYDGYGLTEAAPGVCSTFVSGVVKPGSVGRPFPGVEVMLRDERGDVVDLGDPGEIWVRGANLFSGYWPDGAEAPGPDGWYATGDVAFCDDDGDLYLVDRRKELVIVNGFNVYPREVEQALLDDPSVAEAAVVGVPDEQTGEAVKAFLVLRPGVARTPEAADRVAEHAARRLARFKRPSSLELVDALPHSVTGKVSKRRLREDE